MAKPLSSNQLKRTLHQLLRTKQTRQQFLAFAGLTLVGLIGLGALIRRIASGLSNSLEEAEAGSLSGNATTISDSSAGGGYAVRFGNPPTAGTPSDGLFFDLQPDVLRQNTKKAFAHYFTPYPISLDNKDPSQDYYTTGYLNIHGESNSHQAYGGFFRNRPKGRSPLSGDYQTTDVETEIADARAGGLDGFFVDMLSIPNINQNYTRAARLLTTANSAYPDGSFKVIAQIDTTTGYTKSQTVDDMSDQLASFLSQPSSLNLPDGRRVVSAFKAETYNAAWWDTLFTNVKTRHGYNVAFLPQFLDISQAPNYSGYSWTYGAGDWGDGSDPNIAANASDHSIAVRAAGQKWFQPIQWENVRPNQHVFDESAGTGALRGWWTRAINNNADYAQYVTWSDYSESGISQDSVVSGRVVTDVSSYYLYKWKTGNWPPILKDAIYLSHRSHFSNATFRSGADGQTQFMAHWNRPNKTPNPLDIVEVLTFMTASAQVTATIGGTTHTFTAPAGMSVQTFPLAAGSISASATRNGSTVASVTSPVAVTTTPYKDEWVYYRFSSIRGTAGQFNPNLA